MKDSTKKTLFPLVATVLWFVLVFGVLEVLANIAYVPVKRRWTESKAKANHFYQPSASEVLVYELKPKINYSDGNRFVRTNSDGLRNAEELTAFEDQKKIALIGDSVTFGHKFSQEDTVSAKLQALVNAGECKAKVLNMGVPGYNFWQLRENLIRHLSKYKPEVVVFTLNLNDFSKHESIYQGSSDGLYPMYKEPKLKMIFFANKLFYRWKKKDHIGWYRWMYEGNRDEAYGILVEMKSFAKLSGAEFYMVLYPPGSAYNEEGYSLQDIHDDLYHFAKDQEIQVVDAGPYFMSSYKDSFRGSDHLTVSGNEKLASFIYETIKTSKAICG